MPLPQTRRPLGFGWTEGEPFEAADPLPRILGPYPAPAAGGHAGRVLQRKGGVTPVRHRWVEIHLHHSPLQTWSGTGILPDCPDDVQQ